MVASIIGTNFPHVLNLNLGDNDRVYLIVTLSNTLIKGLKLCLMSTKLNYST